MHVKHKDTRASVPRPGHHDRRSDQVSGWNAVSPVPSQGGTHPQSRFVV